jgi:hypothetical protein
MVATMTGIRHLVFPDFPSRLYYLMSATHDSSHVSNLIEGEIEREIESEIKEEIDRHILSRDPGIQNSTYGRNSNTCKPVESVPISKCKQSPE